MSCLNSIISCLLVVGIHQPCCCDLKLKQHYFHVLILYLSIYIFDDCVLLLHYISEAYIVLFTTCNTTYYHTVHQNAQQCVK